MKNSNLSSKYRNWNYIVLKSISKSGKEHEGQEQQWKNQNPDLFLVYTLFANVITERASKSLCVRVKKVRKIGEFRIALLYQARFLNFSTTDILSQIIICCRSYSVHCKMFRSTLGLYPLDATSTLLSCENQKCLQTWPNIPSGKQFASIWELTLLY